MVFEFSLFSCIDGNFITNIQNFQLGLRYKRGIFQDPRKCTTSDGVDTLTLRFHLRFGLLTCRLSRYQGWYSLPLSLFLQGLGCLVPTFDHSRVRVSTKNSGYPHTKNNLNLRKLASNLTGLQCPSGRRTDFYREVCNCRQDCRYFPRLPLSF